MTSISYMIFEFDYDVRHYHSQNDHYYNPGYCTHGLNKHSRAGNLVFYINVVFLRYLNLR